MEIQLKCALKEKGYKVVDLREELIKRGKTIPYYKLASYCRSINPSYYQDTELHEKIAEIIKDWNVDWKLPQKRGCHIFQERRKEQ